MTKNFELLWKIYDHIVAHPEEWRQMTWVTTLRGDGAEKLPVTKTYQRAGEPAMCGTAFCFAGHVAFAAGWSPIWNSTGHDFVPGSMKKDHERRNVESIANNELGLTREEGWQLFDAYNSLDRIRSIITQWEEEEARA